MYTLKTGLARPAIIMSYYSKTRPVPKTKIWSVVVEAWTLRLPDCVLITPEVKQTAQRTSYGESDGKYTAWQNRSIWQAGKKSTFKEVCSKMLQKVSASHINTTNIIVFWSASYFVIYQFYHFGRFNKSNKNHHRLDTWYRNGSLE